MSKNKKEEVKERKEEMEVYKNASPLRRIFMYHPESPLLVRNISFLLLFPSIGGLGILIFTYLLLTEDIIYGYSAINDYFSVALIYFIMIGTLIASYGISHLKKWSLYLLCVTLLPLLFLDSFYFLVAILATFLVLNHHKKFCY